MTRKRLAALLLLATVTAAPGCTSRFIRRDPAAPSSTAAARPTASETGPVQSEPALRVNLAGLPAALTDAQVASLKRAWEAASGRPIEVATTRADTLADVVLVSSSTLADAVAAKQIVPLATAAAATAGEDVPENVRRALTWKGSVYALPLTARLRVLAYDPARLREAGLDDRPAPTLEALRAQWQAAVAGKAGAAAVAGTDGGTQPPPATSGTTTATGSSLADDVALLAAAFGGSLVDEDGALAVASKPVAQAVEFLKTLRERGLLTDGAGEDHLSAARKPFEFVYRDGSAMNDDNRPVAGLPPALAAYDPAARPFVVVGEVFGVAVSAGARDRALAERFARFLTNPLVSRGLLGSRGLTAPESEGEATFARLASHLTVPGGPLAHARSRAILDRYIRAALDNTLPVGEALAKAAAEIEGRPAPAAPLPLRSGGAAPNADSPRPPQAPPPAPDAGTSSGSSAPASAARARAVR